MITKNGDLEKDIEFITPPNTLKLKVGFGGLNVHTLKRAQDLLDDHKADFVPIAQSYLDQMESGIKEAQSDAHTMERRLDYILLPCSQLRANGRLFQYPMVTRIAGRFATLMDDVRHVDDEVIDISYAFHRALSLVVAHNIKDENHKNAQAVLNEIDQLYQRYTEQR